MEKRFFLILALFFSFGNIFSQTNEKYYSENLFDSIDYNFIINKKHATSLLDRERFSYKITMASSFMSIGGSNVYSSYIIPEFNYKINEKFSFSAGFVSYGSYFPSYTNNKELPMNNKFRTNIGVFAKGYYMPSEKITIYGSFTYFPNIVSDRNFSNTNIGADYKVTKKFSISAELNIIKGGSYYSPYYYNNGLNQSFGFNNYDPFFSY